MNVWETLRFSGLALFLGIRAWTKVAVCQSCFRTVLSLPMLSMFLEVERLSSTNLVIWRWSLPFFDKASLELKNFQFELSIA